MKSTIILLLIITWVTTNPMAQDIRRRYKKRIKDCNDKRFKEFVRLKTFCGRLDFIDKNFGTLKKRDSNEHRADMHYFFCLIERESKIYSKTVQRGIWGYFYAKQGHYLEDMKKWREYFGCKKE